MEEVTKQEWMDWKSSKVTKEYLHRIINKREQLKEGLVEGQAVGVDIERYIGQCQGYKDAFDYAVFDFEYLEEESSEDDNKGNRI